MKKAEALRIIRDLANAEYPTYLLDGVDTYVDTEPEPIYTNYKTAQFCRNMEEYAKRHPEQEKDGIDYVYDLVSHISDEPEVFYFSPAGTEFIEDAWILKRWVDLPGMVGFAYLKCFDIEKPNPIFDVHID